MSGDWAVSLQDNSKGLNGCDSAAFPTMGTHTMESLLLSPPPPSLRHRVSPMRIIKPEKCSVEMGDGTLLAATAWPDETGTKKASIVLCHSHTYWGGHALSMHSLAQYLAQIHCHNVVTFDFRGAGASLGNWTWTGTTEAEDVVEMCVWTRLRFQQPVILVGVSGFAHSVGVAACKAPSCIGYVGIGFFFGGCCVKSSCFLGNHQILAAPLPKLFIMGDQDGYTSTALLREHMQNAYPPCKSVLVCGACHDALTVDPSAGASKFDNILATHITIFASSICEDVFGSTVAADPNLAEPPAIGTIASPRGCVSPVGFGQNNFTAGFSPRNSYT